MIQNRQPIWKNFIVIEGLDGAGTTSQVKLIQEYADNNHLPYWITCEPTNGSIGEHIRRILRKEEELSPQALAYLFAADRANHLYHGTESIRDHLDRGETVICERYIFSSLAYQSLAYPSPSEGFEEILQINRFPLPELLIFIDTPEEECQRRMDGRSTVELFDRPSTQEQVRKNYLYAFDRFSSSGMRFHTLDGSRSKESLFDEIIKLILGSVTR